LRDLVDDGAFVQLTAASVDGRFGGRAATCARTLLEAALAHVLASDGHPPHIREIGLRAALRVLDDDALGSWLTVDVPRALVSGESPPARPPLHAHI
jgi:protein-tyrosine phosphatase